MRFRYKFEDGKHLVRTHDDQQNWLESREYGSQEEAESVARKGEEMRAGTISDVEKAMTGPKGKVTSGVKPKNDMATKAGVVAEFAEADRKGSGDKKDWDYDPHDLTMIPGVGDRTAERLRESGITTLRMLSRVSATKAEELGIKDEWIEEAKRLIPTD